MFEPAKETPNVDTGPTPEGKTTIDDNLAFEPERLSYEVAGEISQQIADLVKQAVRDKTVVVADLDLLTSLSNLVAAGVVLDSLKRTYEGLSGLSESLSRQKSRDLQPMEMRAAMVLPVTPVTAVIAGIQAALGVVRLFREDVDFRGAKTAVDPLTFSLALAARLKERKAEKVFVPALFVLQPADAQSSSLVKSLEEVQTMQQSAWQAIGPLIAQLSRLNAELDGAVAEEDQEKVDQLSATVAALRRDLDPVTEALDRADQVLAQLQMEWQKPEPESGLTGLAKLLRAEALRNMQPLLVHAQVVTSGGHHRIAHSAWRNMFQGDGISAMGGAVARWALLAEDGSTLDGGILTSRRSEKFPTPQG